MEEALRRGFGVWAGIRSSSSREYLQDRKIHFLELDFAHPNELRAQLSGHKGTYSKFDYIIHCAGVTKCVDKSDFKVVPMAANVQIIFFRNEKSGDILVKVMHNENEVHIPVETDMFPYYKWEDVERFYRNLLN